jgi:hypothetical protein
MNSNIDPSPNPPTVSTLIVAFASSLLTWGVTEIDAPAEVEASGMALALFVIAVLAGRIAQKFTNPKNPPAGGG